MIPVLSHFELNVSSLPTALVSNTLTTVETTLTSEEERACQELCYDLGVNYRIRPWQN